MSSAANNANVRRQTPTCARRSWATQTRFLDSSMEMNPSINLIAYSEEDARYRSHWVKSPFMKGITALRSATLKALRLCSIFSASCLNCSLSKMPPNAGFSTNQKKQERQRLVHAPLNPRFQSRRSSSKISPESRLSRPSRICPYQCSQSKHSPTARPSRFRSCVAP